MLAYGMATWIFAIGVYGIATSRNLFHLLGCLALTQSGTYILLLSIGYRKGAPPAILTDIAKGTKVVDPVATSLVLTDVVVGATILALLYAFAVQIFKLHRTLDPDDLAPKDR